MLQPRDKSELINTPMHVDTLLIVISTNKQMLFIFEILASTACIT